MKGGFSLCKFFEKNECKFGEECRFSHDHDAADHDDHHGPGGQFPPGSGNAHHLQAGKGKGSGQVCTFWLKGACRYGPSCRNLHEQPQGYQKGGGSWKSGLPGKKGGPRPAFQNRTWHAGKGPGPVPSPNGQASLDPSLAAKAATGPYLGKGSELLKVWSMPEDMGHHDGIMSAAIMGDRVCTGGADERLLLWRGQQSQQNPGGLELVQENEVGMPGAVTALFYHGASRWLFSGLATGEIKGFRQEPPAQASMAGHTGMVAALLVHETVLLSGAVDSTVKAWTYNDATASFECAATIATPTGEVSCLRVLPNGTLWVGATRGISCVNLQTLQVVGTMESRSPVVSLLQYQDAVVVAFADGVVKLYDGNGKEQFQHGPLGEHTTNTTLAVMQHPYDGSDLLFCGQAVGYVTVYRLPDFAPRGTFNTGFEAEVTQILEMGPGVFSTCGMAGDTVLWRWEDRRGSVIQ
mmetsp:Transcript_65882/g.157492  ORF Transcript_65882/g.157492 Transcript_65882/m.157492 type:complete len:465 (+) Transcript_65882:127-1521(+)